MLSININEVVLSKITTTRRLIKLFANPMTITSKQELNKKKFLFKI